MLRATHALLGFLIGTLFAIWLHLSGYIFPIVVGCILIAIWGSILPDSIDPPTNYLHRSIGHNIVSLVFFAIAAIMGLALSIILRSWYNVWIFILPTAFAFGFLSHLILDMTTPMGLPMFVGKSILGIIVIPALLIPVVNIIMLIITIITAIIGIKYMAKKVGGIWALILLFIPIWGGLLLLGIALLELTAPLWHFLGIILIILFAITMILLVIFGILLNKTIHFSDKIVKKVKNKFHKKVTL
ncbi:MAG: metal-dependent hydrolase [Candidatus Woesearchaeota archaeon]